MSGNKPLAKIDLKEINNYVRVKESSTVMNYKIEDTFTLLSLKSSAVIDCFAFLPENNTASKVIGKTRAIKGLQLQVRCIVCRQSPGGTFSALD